MKKLIDHFDKELKKAKNQNHAEPQIVKAFVESFQTLNPITITGGTVSVKTKFIHQKPYVFFVSPSNLHQAGRTELGDLLFVIKKIKRGERIKKRCIIFQVKNTSTNWIQLTPHQHDFQRDLYSIAFQFGKSFYNKVRWEPILWAHVTHSKWFLSNLFLYPNCEYVTCARDIDSSLSSYRLDLYPGNKYIGINFKDFLNSFFSFSIVGHSLRDQVKDIVELIYKRYDWYLDPQEEWFDNFGAIPGRESEEEGFGVVECVFEYD
ncbi:MAG: hypothetical protein MUO31_03980 [Thermodesulfovibrionales bacterium]|nr:hypothetical protein [Thermodesulfovibrionales bacterium]